MWAALVQRACSPCPRAAIRKGPREAPRAPAAALAEEESERVDIADVEDKLKWTGSHKNKKDDELLMGNINEGDIVYTLKTMIRMKMHLIFTQSADFYMIFNGLRLDDHNTIDHYNIVSGSTVWMVMRLRGGMDAGALVIAIT